MGVTCLQKNNRERGPERRKKECKKRILRIHCKERPKKESEGLTFRKKKTKGKTTATELKGGSECECE